MGCHRMDYKCTDITNVIIYNTPHLLVLVWEGASKGRKMVHACWNMLYTCDGDHKIHE